MSSGFPRQLGDLPNALLPPQESHSSATTHVPVQPFPQNPVDHAATAPLSPENCVRGFVRGGRYGVISVVPPGDGGGVDAISRGDNYSIAALPKTLPRR